MARSTAPGRPRLFCRASHRQRSYESRREANLRGLADGEVLYGTEEIDRIRDAIYVMEAALQDARMDLSQGSLEEYPQAFRALAAAVDSVVRTPLEPKARA